MSDLDVVREIERELNVKLEKADKIKWNSRAYVLNKDGQLTGLGLYRCDIKELKRIISPLKKFENLTILNLSSNQISDISFLKDLVQLQSLVLSNNQISDISFLKDLVQLQSLDLSLNQISDISFLKDLKKLRRLVLQENPIKELPSWITDFNMDIEWKEYGGSGIVFYNNPLKNPPVEIVKQGKAAIKDYFNSLERGEIVKLNEVKLLFVGEGMAGKTSLLKRLQGMDFDGKESQTHGINVVSLNTKDIKDFDLQEECWLNCWDFGGQEIMHASHRFFMSERSLYILVLDSRTDSKKYHWLKHIEKYGGDSPVIVVMNKIDDNPNYNIEQNSINAAFPAIKNRFHRISCRTNEGIEELLKTISKTVPETSLFGTPISINWMKIKDKLLKETKKKQYLNRERFIEICEKNNVEDESSQQTLLKFLHDLGIVLYFEELEKLDIYVLDPHWVTIGVYKIICSGKIEKGFLKKADLKYILNKEAVKTDEYSPIKKGTSYNKPGEQGYIIDIMKQFELCYEYSKRKGTYIIPDLLPKEMENEPELNTTPLLCFVMKYDYLPSSIISRLMIRLKNDIIDGQQWRYGMMLHNREKDCKAKIKSDEQKKSIRIIVQGERFRKREYFSVIRHHILEINGEFENLEVTELIPLPGYPDSYVNYKALLGYEKNGRDEYFDGELGMPFSVSELLDSVISREERAKEKRSMGDININVNPKFENIGNPTLNAGQQQSSDQRAEQTASQEQKTEVTQQVRQDVQNFQEHFKILKEDLLDEIDIAVKDEDEKKRVKKEIEKAGKAIGELENAASNGKKEIGGSTKIRLENFFKSLTDKNSRISKALEFVSDGKAAAQKLAKTYNDFAPFFALPSVPPILLGSGENKKDPE